MDIPKKLSLANLPTRIDELKIGASLNKKIYIKRDDQTGTEISGNKIRKLEFAVREALDEDADVLITCGGIQSNHARATAAVAARLGLGSHLVLRGDEDAVLEGNYFFDRLLGADISLVTAKEYSQSRMEIMQEIKDQLKEQGIKAYIIPEGASNGIGSFGYYKALEEIMDQEKELGISFDAVVTTIGSAGTYTGLLVGKKILGYPGDIIGINICDDEEFFRERSLDLVAQTQSYLDCKLDISNDDIKILDGYTGLGYALSQEEEIEFISDFAKREGIILDPVYTGKAMYGFMKEVEKGSFDQYKNILFIHTGGIFGWNEVARNMLK